MWRGWVALPLSAPVVGGEVENGLSCVCGLSGCFQDGLGCGGRLVLCLVVAVAVCVMGVFGGYREGEAGACGYAIPLAFVIAIISNGWAWAPHAPLDHHHHHAPHTHAQTTKTSSSSFSTQSSSTRRARLTFFIHKPNQARAHPRPLTHDVRSTAPASSHHPPLPLLPALQHRRNTHSRRLLPLLLPFPLGRRCPRSATHPPTHPNPPQPNLPTHPLTHSLHPRAQPNRRLLRYLQSERVAAGSRIHQATGRVDLECGGCIHGGKHLEKHQYDRHAA